MIISTITEAKTKLSALIEKTQQGEKIIIQKAGRSVAVLHRYEEENKERKPGALKGKIKIAEDFDKLPDDIESAFGMD